VRDFRAHAAAAARVSSFGVPSTWTVSTDRGDTSFVLKAEEDIRRLEGGALLIASAHGVQFRIPDVKALDRASRKLLERFSVRRRTGREGSEREEVRGVRALSASLQRPSASLEPPQRCRARRGRHAAHQRAPGDVDERQRQRPVADHRQVGQVVGGVAEQAEQPAQQRGARSTPCASSPARSRTPAARSGRPGRTPPRRPAAGWATSGRPWHPRLARALRKLRLWTTAARR
jgi:hypothetical protein